MSATRPDCQTPSLLDRFVGWLRLVGARTVAQKNDGATGVRSPADGDPASLFQNRGGDADSSIVTAAVAAALLLSITLSTAIGARLLAAANEHRSEAIAVKAAARLAMAREAAEIERARPEIERLLGRRTISELLEHFSRSLPSEARIHMLSREDDGAIVAEIDIFDPDLLRPALASDTPLRSLRIIGQRPVPDGQMRVSLRSELL